MRVVWTEGALGQLSEIVDFIARDSSSRALAFGEKLQAHAARLNEFPDRGRLVPELTGERIPPRELLIGDYRLVYRTRARVVEVIMVVHGKRLFPATA